jgi:phosphoribosylformylglycinamidine synthase
MTATIGVVQFPGTNCELDAVEALRGVGADAVVIWHGDTTLGDVDGVVLPGGFAHGDYLRPGAIARFSPIMTAIRSFADDGGAVLGICNGFQVLTESGLLPGALQKNAGLKFLCGPTTLTVSSTGSVITAETTVGASLRIPVNHFEGNYTCDAETLAALEAGDQVILRYADNPNGSVDDIAGICNATGNVVGLMPHPERAAHRLLGSEDGAVLLRSFVGATSRATPAATVTSAV